MDNNLIARITKEKIQDKLSIVFDKATYPNLTFILITIYIM